MKDIFSFLLCCKPKQDQLKDFQSNEMSVPISNEKSSTKSQHNSNQKPQNEVIKEERITIETIEQKSSRKELNNFTNNNNAQPCNKKESNPKMDKPIAIPIKAPIVRTKVEIIITENTPGIFKNKTLPIRITEFGISENNSGTKDSQSNFIFFGTNESNSNDNSYDIVMSIGEDETNHNELFYILYETNSKSFILKSLTKEYPFSVVLSPKQPLPLEYNQKNYLQLGKVNMSIYPKTQDEFVGIIVKTSNTTSKKQIYSFNKAKFPISIGRSNCSVNVDCESIGKCHAIIDYDTDNHSYYIVDNQTDKRSSLMHLKKGKNLKLNGELLFNLNNRRFTIKEIVS